MWGRSPAPPTASFAVVTTTEPRSARAWAGFGKTLSAAIRQLSAELSDEVVVGHTQVLDAFDDSDDSGDKGPEEHQIEDCFGVFAEVELVDAEVAEEDCEKARRGAIAV